jgi:hypothetical protein
MTCEETCTPVYTVCQYTCKLTVTTRITAIRRINNTFIYIRREKVEELPGKWYFFSLFHITPSPSHCWTPATKFKSFELVVTLLSRYVRRHLMVTIEFARIVARRARRSRRFFTKGAKSGWVPPEALWRSRRSRSSSSPLQGSDDKRLLQLQIRRCGGVMWWGLQGSVFSTRSNYWKTQPWRA